MNPDLLPIIVGVGQINDRPTDPLQGLDPIALMAASLKQAEADAGAPLLSQADYLGVVQQIGFPHLKDVPDAVAERLGANPAVRYQTHGPNGDSPVMLLNEAANRIGAGEIKVALVCGAEALRTAGALAAARSGERRDATREAASRREPSYAQRHGLVAPVDCYPLYENALRARTGQSFADAQAESGVIWSRFSEVAATNENAWIRKAVSPAEVITASERNRPIAFPYTKLQVANAAVNQGAGFIVTSVGEARRLGIPESKWIYVGNGAAAHEPDNLMRRDRFDRSCSMEVSIRRTLELNVVAPDALDKVELYSCFPCIPKMARRIIDWPIDKPASVFGGLTFGGGPIGNYMSHAIASMVDALRADPGTGLLFANGGYATHNHSIIVSARPIAAAQFPRSYDFQAEADAARDPVPELDKDYVGPAQIETFTVLFGREGAPKRGIVVALTPDGKRTLVNVPGDDAATIAGLVTEDANLVGMRGEIALNGDARQWTFVTPN